jgi:murein DD-endopeptidase MepM/ murein hydrolase activator NlpD
MRYAIAQPTQRYRYLHMKMDELAVTLGDKVARGQRLGLVSNDFGGAASTIHLHFEIKTTIALPDGTTQIQFAPPYGRWSIRTSGF